jgi:hypothetical protein
VSWHAGGLKNWLSGSRRIHKSLAQSSHQQEADLANPTTNLLCPSCVYLATIQVSKAYLFKLVVRLKWEMYQKELNTFENIPVV